MTLFYGRQQELAQLQSWLINDHCRMVALLGMGGMGKTTLTAKLAQSLANPVGEEKEADSGNGRSHFDRIIWRSLLNAPPLDELLPEWLQFLSAQQLTQMPPNLDQRLALLLNYLREQRCLLVLDNMESILQGNGQQAGQYRLGYEPYGQLIQRIGQSNHQSCLLITSRERPQGFRRLEGDTPKVQSLALQGLPTKAGQEFLEGRGLAGVDSMTHTLVTRYSGNPLALKLISETIQDLFGGDVAQFLADDTLIFDDIRAILRQQFMRLSPLEREIVIWLMLKREPVTSHQIWASLARPPVRRDFLEGLRSLQRRSILVQNSSSVGVKFTLQNVVTEYVTDHFIEQMIHELTTESLTHFHIHPLLEAQAKDYVRESQRRLILQPIATQLMAREGHPALEARLRRIIAAMQATAPLEPSYAAGNIINLLLSLNSKLNGYDFSKLSVWQAFMGDVKVTEVNFCPIRFNRRCLHRYICDNFVRGGESKWGFAGC